MADAIPVHSKKEEVAEKPAAKKPAPAKKSGPEKREAHIPAAPGNHYELPDGTVVKDN